MGAGLKGQWGVGDPAKAGSDQQSQQFQAAFQSEINAIGGHLEYTAANAEPARHQPLATRRDGLYPAFQGALKQVDPANPSKAQGAIAKVLGDAKALNAEAAKLHTETEKAKTDWDTRQPKFDEAVKHVEELEAWEDPKAKPLRTLVDGIRKQVNDRKYAPASKTLDELLPKLQPIYDAYVTQKQAKEKYEAQLKQLEPKLPKGSLPEDKMSAADQKVIADLRSQMESAAKAKDFEKALEWLESLSLAVASAASRAALNAKGDPEVMHFEGKELRANDELMYKMLGAMAESKGINAPTEFIQRVHGASAVIVGQAGKRDGLYQDILKTLDGANRCLDRDRDEFCRKFESTANEVAKELLEKSKKTIEEELKRLGITGGTMHLETGDLPVFELSNKETAIATRKGAAELLVFAKEVEKTGKASADAFQKLSASQQADPFNLMNRPLVETHEARRKEWSDASDAYEKARRAQVAANPAIALFTEQPGVVEKLTKMASMSDADLANKVGQEAEEKLKNIEKVKSELGKRFTVWGQPHLTKLTLDQLSATPFQREAVDWKAKEKQRQKDDDKLMFAVIAIGLGLASALPTGGVGLIAGIAAAATVAGAALALYQVGEQVNEYTLAVAANATDLDKAKGISLKEPDGFDLAMSCVLALGDVFAAAAAFKALGGIVKAVKGGDVAAALKLAAAAEGAGITGAAKSKIVGEAVSGLSGEAIVKVGKSMAKSGGGTEPAMRRIICASAGTKFEAELKRAMELIKDVEGRIPTRARQMVEAKRVLPLNQETLIEVYGGKEGMTLWGKMWADNARGFYCKEKDLIFLRAGSRDDVLGSLIHEATHRVSYSNQLRQNDFMTEAIAHFAERDFYHTIYGPGGPLYKSPISTERISKMMGMTDDNLMLWVEIEYSLKAKDPVQKLLFANKDNLSAAQIVEQIFSDIGADYHKGLPPVPR